MAKDAPFFRAGVGAVICDDRGRVLVFERAGIADVWQFPQGGIEAGEDPEDAVLREIEEETSIDASRLELIERCPELLAYELPPDKRTSVTGRGQVHAWFLFRFTGDENEIDLTRSEEFSAWRWDTIAAVTDQVVAFRASVYRRLCELFARHLAPRLVTPRPPR